MTLPRNARRSTEGRRAKISRPEEVREAKLPALFVKLSNGTHYGAKYAKARVRIRKGCYWYLVWRDGEATREFYLGKRENSTLRKSAGAGGGRQDLARAARAPARGTK